jgi:hypothetical protein
MNKVRSVTIVLAYLFFVLGVLLYGAYILTSTGTFKQEFKLIISCIVIGGLGGLLYLFRAVYLNYCVTKQWASDWLLWYLVRPFTSSICGGVSYLFLKAGLLVLEAQKEANASNLGYYALAFVAGMNVDKFIAKIEDLAQATWGIEKSRSSSIKENKNN